MSKAMNQDPLDAMLALEHLNETEPERERRVEKEKTAKVMSEKIDKALKDERAAAKRIVKILLLGQSESGKSTTLKNFQLMHSPSIFRIERASWRAVIQLNVVRSFRLILATMKNANPPSVPGSPKSPTPSSFSGTLYPSLTSSHMLLKMRLAPLASLEKSLLHRLNPCDETIPRDGPLSERPTNVPEPVVNSSAQWKGAFNRMVNRPAMASEESFESGNMVDWNNPEDPGVVLHACSADMVALWSDPTIRLLLEIEGLRLQDMAGFFLDSLERVTALKYIPSDGDILKARLKTLGVTEYNFKLGLKTSTTVSHDYRVFDVGGQRSLRAAWVPYFDDVDSIIFLAPISCVDQVLAEAPTVNRLEDSILLWRLIVTNPLLAKTALCLFLNKCDILKAKLAAGLQLNKYITSYGTRPNDFEEACTYLKKQFASIMKNATAVTGQRSLYCHLTSVTDPKATTKILDNIQDMLVRRNLKDTSLIS